MTEPTVKPIVEAKVEPTPVSIPPLAYKGIMGSLGLPKWKNDKITSIQWEGCRDRFQTASESPEIMDFLFYHADGASENVVDFLKTVEKVVKLPPEDILEFRKTNNPNVLYVKMSPWWKYRVRRSLLTALLRSGQQYTTRTAKAFDKALYSQYYLSQTKAAVEQFLKGRTGSKMKKKHIFGGWYATFVNKSEKDVRQTLVKIKPKSTKVETEPTVPAEVPTKE